jgi:hypothetical protein
VDCRLAPEFRPRRAADAHKRSDVVNAYASQPQRTRATKHETLASMLRFRTVMSPSPDRGDAGQVASGARLPSSAVEREEALPRSESQWYRILIDRSIQGIP